MKLFCPDSELRAAVDGSFTLANSKQTEDIPDRKASKKLLKQQAQQCDELQRRLYANDAHSVLCVFQAIDAAGKDSTIRAVFGRLNPAGCQVYSFKQPSKEELDHDFLWRTSCRLPERGRIGVFNRSYYEEVLVVKVHPEYLSSQRLDENASDDFWQARYESIREHEKHLVRNGTVVLKFWLNVSKEEQRQRFLSRLNEQEKNWKFSAGDLKERQHWDEYMLAYEQCIQNTSTDFAPWYVIPADDKPYMRYQVADILRQTLENINPQYPTLGADERAELDQYAEQLNNEEYS
ncbi:MAG: PPK2 family polyphosphate kinase [Pseudomonadales bacterium]